MYDPQKVSLMISNIFKAIGILFLSLFFGLISLIVYIWIVSRTTETIITDHPLIGQTFTAGAPIFYMEKCNNFHSCGATKIHKEIDRSLVCDRLNLTVTGIYDNVYEITDETTFVLVKLLKIESYGLDAFGGDGYTLAVLSSDKGILSTILFSSLNQEDSPWGFQNNTVCETS